MVKFEVNSFPKEYGFPTCAYPRNIQFKEIEESKKDLQQIAKERATLENHGNSFIEFVLCHKDNLGYFGHVYYDASKYLLENLELEEDRLRKLKDLFNEFPDLHTGTDRWNRIFYKSVIVNSIAEKVEITHSCSCCPDAPLLCRPYVIRNGIEIYSNPHEICIGTKNAYEFGDTPDINYKNKLVDLKIPEKIIEEIKLYFMKQNYI